MITKQTDKKLEIKEIEDDFDVMCELVGGYLDVEHLPRSIALYMNDDRSEGIDIEYESNYLKIRGNKNLDPIAGSVFFAGRDLDGSPLSLTDSQIQWLKDNVVIYDFKISEAAHSFEETT